VSCGIEPHSFNPLRCDRDQPPLEEEGAVAEAPLEYVVIGFAGNQFKGEIIPALREVVEKGIIRVIDIVFARRDADGSLTVLELDDLDEESARAFSPVVTDVTGMFSEDDIREISEELEPNSSAAVILFQHAWADKLRDAVLRANGRLLAGGLIPNEVAEEARNAAARSAA
jgi:uncharacterized membrane protein